MNSRTTLSNESQELNSASKALSASVISDNESLQAEKWQPLLWLENQWLENQWLESQQTQAELSTPKWLLSLQQHVQQQAMNALKGFGWPTRKTEAWKYTPIAQFLDEELLRLYGTSDDSLQGGLQDSQSISGRDTQSINLPKVIVSEQSTGVSQESAVSESLVLVFVNGVFQVELSTLDALPEGVSFISYEQANSEQQRYLQAELNKDLPAEHALTALHKLRSASGWLLDIGGQTQVSQPVTLMHYQDGQAQGHCPVRLHVRVQTDSQVTLIEQHQAVASNSCSTKPCATNPCRVFEHPEVRIDVQQHAQLIHAVIDETQSSAANVASWHLVLEKGAAVNSLVFALGSKLKRIDYNIAHQGEGADSKLNAVLMPKDQEHLDLHTQFDHQVPHTQSQQQVRVLLDDSAKGVFNGRIHIHPDAQKTQAHLSNKNLLLSHKTQMNTKPELEIYADDVRCAHGATVSQLDHEALGYLRARGISEAQAQRMLSLGFVQALIQEFPLEAISDYLIQRVNHWFAQ